MTSVTPDFTSMTPDELTYFLASHAREFDGNVCPADVEPELASGNTVLETRPYGFALIQEPELLPHLWVLYIAPEHRGKGLGHRFMRELLRKYSDFHMTLRCHGPKRRAFFGRLGFVVIRRFEDGMRSMTTDREWRCWHHAEE